MSLRDIALGRYVHGSSLMHRLDPRTKLAALSALTLVLFGGTGFFGVAVAAGICLWAASLSGINPGYLIRTLRPFRWFVILTVLLHLLFTGGHILIEAPLPYGGVTEEGLSGGLLTGARLVMVVLAASLLTLTTQPVVLIAGIERLLAPLERFRITPHDLALAMVITIGFVPVLLNEAHRIRKSHAARGLAPEGNLAARVRSLSLMLVPLVVSSVKRADDLALAMECRLFRGSAHRTRYRELRMTGADALVLTGSLLLAVAVLINRVVPT